MMTDEYDKVKTQLGIDQILADSEESEPDSYIGKFSCVCLSETCVYVYRTENPTEKTGNYEPSSVKDAQ